MPRENRKPLIRGGLGGEGGRGGRKGGDGGLGEATQMHLDEVDRFREIRGGIGGTGGDSDVTGGTGGTGQGNKFGKQIAKGRPAHPQMPVAELAKYQLSPQICAFLKGQGYDTVGGLFEATDIELKEAGLKPGHINQLKSALKQLPLKKSGIRGIRRVLHSLSL